MNKLLDSLKEVDKYIEDNKLLAMKLFDIQSGIWKYILALQEVDNKVLEIDFRKNFLIEKCQILSNSRNFFNDIILDYKSDRSRYSEFSKGEQRFSFEKAEQSNLKPYLEI